MVRRLDFTFLTTKEKLLWMMRNSAHFILGHHKNAYNEQLKSVNTEAYWQYEVKNKKVSNDEMSARARQSNFKLGNDK